MSNNETFVAGIDVGTECVKAVVLGADGIIHGRSVVPTRGYFQERVREALDSALDDAGQAESGLASVCATGFGARLVPSATKNCGEAVCHALGAWHHFTRPMTIVDIGGQESRVIRVEDDGHPSEVSTLRQCAVGAGAFLLFVARHLDVHPAQLQELAAAADEPAPIGNYCSVFSGSEVLERLREGASREEVALGCIHSIVDCIVEIGGFTDPVKLTGGVVEYLPGLARTLGDITQHPVETIPEPIMAGALGAALRAQRSAEISTG